MQIHCRFNISNIFQIRMRQSTYFSSVFSSLFLNGILTCFQFSFLSFSLFSFFKLHQVRQVLNTPSEYLFIYTNAKTRYLASIRKLLVNHLFIFWWDIIKCQTNRIIQRQPKNTCFQKILFNESRFLISQNDYVFCFPYFLCTLCSQFIRVVLGENLIYFSKVFEFVV